MIDKRSLQSTVALEAVLRRGQEALAAGKIEGALQSFNDALRIKPTYAPAWRAKGRAFRAAGDAKSALQSYAEALKLAPEDESSWFGLALSLHDLGRREEELSAYDELLLRYPRNTAAWMNKVVTLHEAGRFAEALEACDRLLAFKPEVPAAWNNRGAVLLRLNRLEEALSAFDEALALDPKFADAIANRQTVLGRLGRREAEPAPYAMPGSVTIPPNLQPTVLANLGWSAVGTWSGTPPASAEDFVSFGTTLLDAGNPATAASAFGKAEAMGAGPVAGVGKLVALSAMKDARLPAEGDRLLAEFTELPAVAFAVARARDLAQDRKGAVAALDAVLSARPDLGWLWEWKGLLEIEMWRNDDARMSFEGATAVEPESPEAWTNLGAALFLSGDSKAALDACDRAVALDPTFAPAETNRGVILNALGRAGDADAAFRRARKSGDVVCSLVRGQFLEARGRNREAHSLYDALIAGGSKDPAVLAGRRRVLRRQAPKSRSR